MKPTLIVNGNAYAYQTQTIRELLMAYRTTSDQPGIAVAVNTNVIPRALWDTYALQPSDQVEIVRAQVGN